MWPAPARTTLVPVTIYGARLRPRAGVELALLALLYVGYSAARLLADGDVGRAVANAHHLLHLESVLHLDVERSANHLLTDAPGLALVASYWYSALHYIVTPAVLIWVYRRHALGYRRVRNALVLATATGLSGFVLLPMAPPRMLPGYVDVLASTSGSGWWGSDASAPKGLGSLTNELAAMPSLHVGWALWCAWVVFLCTRNRWLRVIVACYAAGTTLVVIATANHYVLDAVAGAVVVAVAVAVTRPRVSRGSAPRQPARRQPSAAASSAPRSDPRPVPSVR
jgi:PAP2 superfamily